MVYTVKRCNDIYGQVSITAYGFCRKHKNVETVAQKLGIDARELFWQLQNRGGMTLIVKHGKKHRYA